MRRQRAWVIPDEDARSLFQQIEERIRASNIKVEHRDVLIRLRSLIEENLANLSQTGSQDPPAHPSFSSRASQCVGFAIEPEAAKPITLPGRKPIKMVPRQQERRLLLWCLEKGGWNTGEWCGGRWLDSLTLTEKLEPVCWTEVPPDSAEE
jgi:hypothetical protein